MLDRKSRKMISVSPDTTVIDALRLMAEKNIGSVVVMESDHYKGIVTERDYSRKVILKGKSSTDTKVADIMTTELPTVQPADSIEHCMQLITKENVRYLPVESSGEIINIISISDVVKETILSQQETISNLQEYLHANA